MVAKGGHPLLQQSAVAALKQQLLPLALVVTPNIPEAEILSGITIDSPDAAREAARAIVALGPRWVVVKGGHLAGDATIWSSMASTLRSSALERIDTPNTHGTGGTFSAAIAALLARGLSPLEAIDEAKSWLTGAIRESYAIGDGHSPVNHFHAVDLAPVAGNRDSREPGQGAGAMEWQNRAARPPVGLLRCRSRADRPGLPRPGRRALAGGFPSLQLRAKRMGGRDMYDLAVRPPRPLSGPPARFFFVNDRVDVALASDADGVHVGMHDLPLGATRRLVGRGMLIGFSPLAMADVLMAKTGGADYVGLGPVFGTLSKADAQPPLGLFGLAEQAAAAGLPSVGIGGIDVANAGSVIRAGVDGVAVISAIQSAPNPKQAAESLSLAVNLAKIER